MGLLRHYLLGGIVAATAVVGCGPHRDQTATPFYHGETTYEGRRLNYDVYREHGRIAISVYDGHRDVLNLRDNNGNSNLFDEGSPDEAREHIPSGERSYTLERVVDEEGRTFRDTDSPLDRPVINAAKAKMRELRDLYRHLLSEAGIELAGKIK